jgi:membrane-associated phospholipid phosphatase
LFKDTTWGFPGASVGYTIDVPIVVALLVGGVTGVLVMLGVRRFPALDPTAPRVNPEKLLEAGAAPPVRGFVRTRLDPETTTGLLLTTALVIVLGAAIAIGALLVMAQHNAFLARYDLTAARWGATNATDTSTRWLRNVSLLGGTPAMIVIAVIAAIVEFARTRIREVFLFLLVVVVGQVLLMNLTKLIVDRPRPHIAQLTGFSGSSFPSGHSATAAATFAAVAFLVGRGRSQWIKAIAAGIAFGIAVTVAASRVFLGVHWFTDVLAGLALGWGWFALCSIAFGGRILRFGRPVETARVAADAAPNAEAGRAAGREQTAGATHR